MGRGHQIAIKYILFGSLFHLAAGLHREHDISRATTGLNNNTPTLCFYANQAGPRGTEIGMYDFADEAERQWCTTSKIIFPSKEWAKKDKPASTLSKFISRFGESNVIGSDSYDSIRRTAVKHGCDFLYVVKYGTKKSEPSWWALKPHGQDNLKVGIHNVFVIGDGERHGDTYCSYAAEMKTACIVPYMVAYPPADAQRYGNLRKELGIPQDATVLCRHGGTNTFDLRDAHLAVIDTARQYGNKLHFVMLNTNTFDGGELPNIHYVSATTTIEGKERFFNTCDGMIHGRSSGETFGLSVAEFSVRNKPVITYPGKDQVHVNILGDVGYVYHNAGEARQHIQGFVEHGIPRKQYNAYGSYSPDQIMKKFRDGFLAPSGIDVGDCGKSKARMSGASLYKDTWVERHLLADA